LPGSPPPDRGDPRIYAPDLTADQLLTNWSRDTLRFWTEQGQPGFELTAGNGILPEERFGVLREYGLLAWLLANNGLRALIEVTGEKDPYRFDREFTWRVTRYVFPRRTPAGQDAWLHRYTFSAVARPKTITVAANNETEVEIKTTAEWIERRTGSITP